MYVVSADTLRDTGSTAASRCAGWKAAATSGSNSRDVTESYGGFCVLWLWLQSAGLHWWLTHFKLWICRVWLPRSKDRNRCAADVGIFRRGSGDVGGDKMHRIRPSFQPFQGQRRSACWDSPSYPDSNREQLGKPAWHGLKEAGVSQRQVRHFQAPLCFSSTKDPTHNALSFPLQEKPNHSAL